MFGAIENPAYVQYGKDIQISGELLLGLISDILDVSQIDAEEMSLKEQPEDVAAIVDECILLLQSRVVEAGIELSVDLSRSPASIYVDGRRIKQILVNLIGNAIKFTPAGGSIDVAVGPAAPTNTPLAVAPNEAEQLSISVRDSGIGMSEMDIERALQPFSQLEANALHGPEGVGLGLSIASRLAVLHDGYLHLSSQPGAGTLAQILLPGSRIIRQDDSRAQI
jgi:signal transduction histidine kinase